MVKQIKSECSFTMIELLIVIIVLGLFSGFSIATYSQFTEEKKLENATKKIVSILELARSKTNAVNSDLCNSDVLFREYDVEIINENTLRMQPYCYSSISGQAVTPTPILYFNEANIIFPVIAVKTSFQKTNPNANCACFIVKSTTKNKCRYVKIANSGLISEDSCSCAACCSCP